jgi:hypothetical protein
MKGCVFCVVLSFFVITLALCPMCLATTVTLPLTVWDERFFRTTLAIGSPVQNVYALLDFSNAHILVHPSVVEESQTYTVAAAAAAAAASSGHDYVRFGHESPVFLPLRIAQDSMTLSRMNAATALVVVGMGLGSPVWQHWRCGTFAASHVTLSRDACDRCDSQLFHCEAAFGNWTVSQPLYVSNALCAVQAGFVKLLAEPRRQQFGRLFFFGHGLHESALPPVILQHLRHSYGPLQSGRLEKTMPNLCFGERHCGGGGGVCATLCMFPETYVSTRHVRHRLALDSSGTNDSVISTDALFAYQFHYDHEAQTLCAVEARIVAHAPPFHVALMVLWVILLVVWRSLNTRYIGVLCAGHIYRMSRAPVIFVEIALVSSVLVFIIHFCLRSMVWQLPLPDGGWILHFYVTLTVCCTVVGFFDFYRLLLVGGGGGRIWLGRPLLVEVQVLLVLWLVQLHALSGVWYSYMSVFFFGVFYLYWTQRLLTLLMARWNSHLPISVRSRASKANRLLLFLSILYPVHSYVFLHRLLLPLVLTSPIGNDGYVHALMVTSPILLHVLYKMTTKARIDLFEEAISAAAALVLAKQ